MNARTGGARRIEIGNETRRLLVEKLKAGPEIITYAEDPTLASLCTVLGLQFEMGKRESDRLSPFFGVEVPLSGDSPWCHEIFTQDGEFGIRFARREGGALEVRHPDFCHILDPSSFDETGLLSSVVIFPARVAKAYAAKGFELVIVRDWLLTSALCEKEEERVTYLYANEWEIQNNIAHTQASLMLQRRLAFSGTHDIADHLLGADAVRFDECRDLFLEAAQVFTHVFWKRTSATKQKLLLSYLIGVVLDDLAQPRWYGSAKHRYLAQKALDELLHITRVQDVDSFALPPSFQHLVDSLRAKEKPLFHLESGFSQFLSYLN